GLAELFGLGLLCILCLLRRLDRRLHGLNGLEAEFFGPCFEGLLCRRFLRPRQPLGYQGVNVGLLFGRKLDLLSLSSGSLLVAVTASTVCPGVGLATIGETLQVEGKLVHVDTSVFGPSPVIQQFYAVL